MTDSEALRNLWEPLALPSEATDFLLILWDSFQFFDDVVDRDSYLPRIFTERILTDLLVRLPSNGFFREHHSELVPVILNAILQWKASDEAERGGRADSLSFVWRASYYTVVLQVLSITEGIEVAMANAEYVLRMYGETFRDYKNEF
jgi:hypothetical protein